MNRSRTPLLLAVAPLLIAACGTDEGSDAGGGASSSVAGTAEPAEARPIALADRASPSGDATIAGGAVTAFGFDLFDAAARSTDDASSNLVLSPLSVAIALAMLEPGANDDALAQLHELLRIDDPVAWHASMNAVEQGLEGRDVDTSTVGPDEDPGEFGATIANGGFLQPGYPFRSGYLDTIGSNYGAVLEELDFHDADAAAARINDFIADATDDHITDLVQASDIDPATKLALVNALLLQASWQESFDAGDTTDETFTLIDGDDVTVPLMAGRSDRSGRGDGWVGASKQLVGDVRLDVALPDEGRFDDVAARADEVFAELEEAPNPSGALLVPRLETRVTVGLTDALRAAGLTAPFTEGQLMGIADDERLVLDQALHQTWLSIDEDGIEAAAATVLLMVATSAPTDEPVDVVLDRPFLLRIVDGASGATMFLGRIMDPTA